MHLRCRPLRPANPRFSTGPTAKIPGWSTEHLAHALVGRAHRSREARARLKYTLDLTHEILQLPADYRIAIVPASDTGAVEMALWSLLGARGVDMLAWESFGSGWVKDVADQLKLEDVRVIEADYGALPDLSQVDPTAMSCSPGTAPRQACVSRCRLDCADRRGLTICDATSAVFAQALDWTSSMS